MRIAIVSTHVPFVHGGAEVLAEDLRTALTSAGHEAEIVAIPARWYSAPVLLEQALACRLIDLTTSGGRPIDRVIALKYPAYLVRHPNKVLWLAHQHRAAYDAWAGDFGMINEPGGATVREAIRRTDIMACREARHVMTISRNVAHRLRDGCDVEARVLYPPPRNVDKFYCAEDEGFLFFPSRITPYKRQTLALEALARTRLPVRLAFAGVGDTKALEAEVKAYATELGVDSRVDWLGWISYEEMYRRYAHCRGVVFPPLDEDYGYITLEGMLASKPVVTCRDSGGSLEFIVDGENGLIAEAEASSLAAAMDTLWEDQERAAAWGAAGRRLYADLDIGWQQALEALLQ